MSAVQAPTTGTPPAQVEQVNLRSLLWIGPLILVTSLLVNAIIRAVVLALFDIPESFTPISSPSFIGLTIGGVIAALIVFVIVARFSKRPYWLYLRIAIVALLVSFIPDLLLFVNPPPATDGSPGPPVPIIGPIVLMLQHTATAAIVVYMLNRFTRA